MRNFSKKVMESREYAEDWLQAAESVLMCVRSILAESDKRWGKSEPTEGTGYTRVPETLANKLFSKINILDSVDFAHESRMGDGRIDKIIQRAGTDYRGLETPNREHKTIEIDGPTLSMFPMDLCGERDVNIYKTIVYRGKSPDVCILEMEAALNKIRAQSDIIIYRVRPSLEPVYNGDEYIYHQCRCRLTTVPDLTHEQWDDIGIKEEGADIMRRDPTGEEVLIV